MLAALAVSDLELRVPFADRPDGFRGDPFGVLYADEVDDMAGGVKDSFRDVAGSPATSCMGEPDR